MSSTQPRFDSDEDQPRPLDELDLAVVHALQIDARAPWTRVAAAVGADAATVTRRFEQMRDERLAWLTCWPKAEQWRASTDLAMVVLEAHADLDAIGALPWVLSVDETSAGVVALVASSSGLRGLGARVRELAEASGTTAPRMHVVSSVFAEDSMWRTRALDARGQKIMAEPAAGDAPSAPKPALVAELAGALADDPRMSAAKLGAQLGVSEATARRAVERAALSGRLGLGCDLAVPAAGLRRGAMLWARSSQLHTAGAQARHLPQSYRVLEVVGPAPLSISVRATTLTALPEIERALGGEIEIVDRWTLLGTHKRNGHLLDDWGRTRGRVEVHW
jgi:DNA-binding Lrp family transcriptional regulator